jgi:hypothetical protein
MSEIDLTTLTQTTVVLYKSKDGSTKELRVVQPMDPDQRHFTFKELQILAREIGNVLKEDAQ